MKTNRHGTTLVEILIAASLLSLILGMAWRLMSIVNSTGGTSLENLYQRTMLNQDVVTGMEKLYNRLQEGIEILEPRPGKVSTKLVFRDLLNHTVTLKIVSNDRNRPGILVSTCADSGTPEEKGRGCPAHEKSENNVVGNQFFPVPPVRIENVKSVTFTSLSATCININLILSLSNAEVPMAVTIKMKNSGLVYQQ